MNNFAGFQIDEVVNGNGLGATIYFQGCSHHCKGCHNSETWEFGKGNYNLKDIIDKIIMYFNNTPFATRLTFSGGDPLDNISDTKLIVDYMKKNYPSIQLWLYTGYILESLSKEQQELCKEFSYVVDGPFILEKRNISLPFRGSDNQRILTNEQINLLCQNF